MNYTEALEALLAPAGRTARPAQLLLDGPLARGQHVAARALTGSGKSLIAAAVGVANASNGEKTVVGMFSNGLCAQYLAEAPEWEAATGVSFAVLVGQGHYWCPKASPSLAGLTSDQQDAVRKNDGLLIGCGLDPKTYWVHSVKALVPELEEDADDDAPKGSPCKTCSFNLDGTCPMMNARKAAHTADVTITNTTIVGLAINGRGPLAFDQDNLPHLVLDEAHAAAQPIREVLSSALTIRRSAKLGITADDVAQALSGPLPAKDLLRTWADDESHPMCLKARGLFGASKGIGIEWSTEDDKVRLFVPINLTETFAPYRVLAMSGTLTQPTVKDLGLNAQVIELPGLDVSASAVTESTCPAWSYVDNGPWAECVAEKVSALAVNGRAFVIFQSNKDQEAVLALLPASVRSTLIEYNSKVDRTDAVRRYKAAPEKHVMIGFSAGLGTGVNAPGELVRDILITRVPQKGPQGVDPSKFKRDSCSAIVQSVGRGVRGDGDWARIEIVGGFGARTDIKAALKKDGWSV